MKVRSLLMVIVFWSLFISGCVTTQDQLTQDEIRSLNAVNSVFEEHDMKILSDLCSSREVVAAMQKVQPCDNCDEHHSDSADGPGEHKFIVIGKAIPDASGKYPQPVFALGEQMYFYKAIYTATLEDKVIRVTKTTGSEESPFRAEATVEPEILQEIAKQISGRVQDDCVAW